MTSDIQSIIFNNKKYNNTKAIKWLTKNGYEPIKKVHITKNFLRYRLKNPRLFKRFYINKTANIDYIIGIYK